MDVQQGDFLTDIVSRRDIHYIQRMRIELMPNSMFPGDSCFAPIHKINQKFWITSVFQFDTNVHTFIYLNTMWPSNNICLKTVDGNLHDRITMENNRLGDTVPNG